MCMNQVNCFWTFSWRSQGWGYFLHLVTSSVIAGASLCSSRAEAEQSYPFAHTGSSFSSVGKQKAGSCFLIYIKPLFLEVGSQSIKLTQELRKILLLTECSLFIHTCEKQDNSVGNSQYSIFLVFLVTYLFPVVSVCITECLGIHYPAS